MMSVFNWFSTLHMQYVSTTDDSIPLYQNHWLQYSDIFQNILALYKFRSKYFGGIYAGQLSPLLKTLKSFYYGSLLSSGLVDPLLLSTLSFAVKWWFKTATSSGKIDKRNSGGYPISSKPNHIQFFQTYYWITKVQVAPHTGKIFHTAKPYRILTS